MAKSLSQGAHTNQAGTQRVQGQHGCPHRKTLRDVVVLSDGAGDLRVPQEQWTQRHAAFAALQCPLFREAKHLPPPSSEATQSSRHFSPVNHFSFEEKNIDGTFA